MKVKELITPEMLWTVLLNTYMSSINEYKSLSLFNTEEYDKLLQLKNEMKNSGLSNTESYKAILRRIDKLEYLAESRKASEFLVQLKGIYPDSIVIPYKKLYNILDKYDLEMAPINYYTKVIPSCNIEEIISVSKSYYKHNIPGIPTHHIKEITITSDMNCDEVVRVFSRIPFVLNKYHETIRTNEKISDDLINHISVNITPNLEYDRKSWIIIAPREEIKEQCVINVETYKEHEERYKVQDPLVGKFCKYGFIIFSKWGKEADIHEFNDWLEKK